MAKKWGKFPHADKAYAYDAAALKKQWPRLHRGDCEALPKDAAVLEAWRHYHAGEFAQAVDAGNAAGGAGANAAIKAQVVYATYLEKSDKAKLALLDEAMAWGEARRRAAPKDPNAHYFFAFAAGRYGQGISVAKALAQGLGGKVRDALLAAIKLEPKHADAHIAYGSYQAEVIDKVGGLVAAMTYGAKKDSAVEHFQKAAEAQPRFRDRPRRIRERTASCCSASRGSPMPKSSTGKPRRASLPMRWSGSTSSLPGRSSPEEKDDMTLWRQALIAALATRRARCGYARGRAGQSAGQSGPARHGRCAGGPRRPGREDRHAEAHPRYRHDPHRRARGVGAVLFPRRAKAAAGLLGRSLPQGRRGDQGRAQDAAPRGEIRAGQLRQPDPRAAAEQDRPRMRIDDQHARPPEAGRVRVHDVHRRHQDAREDVVERQRHRGPSRQDDRRHQGHDQREDDEAAERRAAAEAHHPRDDRPQRFLQGGRGRQGDRLPDGRRAALRPHLEIVEARRLRRSRQIPVGRALRDHDAQGRAAAGAGRQPRADRTCSSPARSGACTRSGSRPRT